MRTIAFLFIFILIEELKLKQFSFFFLFSVYTYFAAAEYLIVWSNILFHAVSFLKHFPNGELTFAVDNSKKIN